MNVELSEKSLFRSKNLQTQDEKELVWGLVTHIFVEQHGTMEKGGSRKRLSNVVDVLISNENNVLNKKDKQCLKNLTGFQGDESEMILCYWRESLIHHVVKFRHKIYTTWLNANISWLAFWKAAFPIKGVMIADITWGELRLKLGLHWWLKCSKNNGFA